MPRPRSDHSGYPDRDRRDYYLRASIVDRRDPVPCQMSATRVILSPSGERTSALFVVGFTVAAAPIFSMSYACRHRALDAR